MPDARLPSGWKQTNLAGLADYINGFAFNESYWSAEGLPIVRIAQITGSQGIVDRYKGSLPDAYRLEDGNLIFSWSGTLAVVRWNGGPAWLNQHLFKVVPRSDVNRDLLFHLLQASVAEMDKRSHGSTMKHIKRGELREFDVTLPVDAAEQRGLANVLDTLDTTIRQTEAIIEKLKQVKQGLLHDLLTRGIDANGELRPPQSQAPHLYKESPLGWIPREWDAVPLGRVIADAYRYPSYFGIDYMDSGVPEIRGELIEADGSLDARTEKYRYISKATAARFARVHLRQDDVVMSVRGTIGKFALVPERLSGAVITANLLKLTPDRTVVRPDWLLRLLLSPRFQNPLDAACSSTTIKTIQVPELMAIRIALPSLTEQLVANDRLHAIDRVSAAETAALEKLKLQKTGLMDDLLTGRVRVTPLLDANHR